LEYNKAGFVGLDLYMESNIFMTSPDRCTGEDHVSGRIGETNLEFSELQTEYRTETRDKNGNLQESWHVIFKGLFLVADFNKNFTGCTVVLPDTAERLFGFIGKAIQSMNVMRGKLIKLEDPEFEKYFVVYGEDQIMARYILSTSLMERITEFRKKTNRPIYLSFVNSKVFVAITHTENMFEPKLFSSIVDFDVIRKYYDDLELGAGIVEELDLNTRIWTKE